MAYTEGRLATIKEVGIMDEKRNRTYKRKLECTNLLKKATQHLRRKVELGQP